MTAQLSVGYLPQGLIGEWPCSHAARFPLPFDSQEGQILRVCLNKAGVPDALGRPGARDTRCDQVVLDRDRRVILVRLRKQGVLAEEVKLAVGQRAVSVAVRRCQWRQTRGERRQHVRAVQVRLVSRLEREKVVAQDSFSLLGDLEAEVRRVVEGNTCAYVGCMPGECGYGWTYRGTIWR